MLPTPPAPAELLDTICSRRVELADDCPYNPLQRQRWRCPLHCDSFLLVVEERVRQQLPAALAAAGECQWHLSPRIIEFDLWQSVAAAALPELHPGLQRVAPRWDGSWVELPPESPQALTMNDWVPQGDEEGAW